MKLSSDRSFFSAPLGELADDSLVFLTSILIENQGSKKAIYLFTWTSQRWVIHRRHTML